MRLYGVLDAGYDYIMMNLIVFKFAKGPMVIPTCCHNIEVFC